ITAFTAYSADMNRAPAPVTSIEEMSLNRLWAAPTLTRLSFNHLAVSGRTVAVPSDQLGRWLASRQLDRRAVPSPMAEPVDTAPASGQDSPAAHDRDRSRPPRHSPPHSGPRPGCCNR